VRGGCCLLATEPYRHLDSVHKITDYNKVTLDQIKHKTSDKIYACVDYNCFYAQIAEWDNQVQGIPLIVGGWRKREGVAYGIVATSNYAARAVGIKTGISAQEAIQNFKDVLMYQVDYEKYKAISKTLIPIFKNYSHSIEAYSMDEVFMDLTGHVKSKADCEKLIRDLKKDIWETQRLTVNVGIATTKTQAKMAVEFNKPNGHAIILTEEDKKRLIDPLSPIEMWGIGRKRLAKLEEHGYYSIGDIANERFQVLQQLFGKNDGYIIWLMATGNEETLIVKKKPRDIQALSQMHTFPKATLDRDELWGEFVRYTELMCYRLRGHNKKASEFYFLFRPQRADSFGAGIRIDYTNLERDVFPAMKPHFNKMYAFALKNKIEIRGIGVFGNRFDTVNENQLNLFSPKVDWKTQNLFQAIDRIKNKYSLKDIQSADSLSFVKGRTHFVDRSTY
jgi:DNA polymerase-4